MTGFLTQEYLDNAVQQAVQPEQPIVEPKPQAPPIKEGSIPGEETKPGFIFKEGPVEDVLIKKQFEFAEGAPKKSKEEQTEKFGGPVGSPEYYRYKAEHPYRSYLARGIGESFGLKFPEQETWDKMKFRDRALFTNAATLPALTRTIKSLPKEVLKAPLRLTATILAPWEQMASGKTGSIESLKKETIVAQVPWLGAIPTYYQTFDRAEQSGMGKWAAGLMTVGQVTGDIAITASLAEAASSAFRPRETLAPGTKIKQTQPIKDAFIQDKGVIKKASPSEYYSVPKTVAKNYGGKTNNTFLKVTPAGESSMELAVIQVREGAIPKGIDYFKSKLGFADRAYPGGFGREIKLDAQVVNVSKPLIETSVTAADLQVVPFSEALAKSSIKKGLQPAALEAVKFNTVEEFLDTQTKVFRGGDFNPNKIGIPVTTDRNIAKSFPFELPPDKALFKGSEENLLEQVGRGKTKEQVEALLSETQKIREAGVKEFFISKQAKILSDRSMVPKELIDDSFSDFFNLSEWAKEKGFDVMDFDKLKIGFGEEEVRVLNSDILKTKQQLTDTFNQAKELEKSTIQKAPDTKSKVLAQIPPRALKGFEAKFITEPQMQHLSEIAIVNGVESAIKDAVVRTVTGKKILGELTQAEYVNAAQTLAKFNEIQKFDPTANGGNAFSRYLSPQRHWMRAYEEKVGLPLYSEVYVPMEEAVRLRNVFRNSYRNQARDIHGKYSKPGFGPERRLINSYMKGKTEAITANETLDKVTKAELIEIATKMRSMYDTVAPQLEVPTEIFLDDYQPVIQEMGGVYQLYKSDVTEVPKELTFFAEFKRHGNLGIAVDDSLALWDIYINAGSNKTFLNPVLKRTGEFIPQLPEKIQGSAKSYMLEKMGYAGKLEKTLNNAFIGINQKLGTNLPADTARQMTQVWMDTTYSGALGLNPGKAARNMLQTELMTYPRLGPRFYGDAAKKALTPEGMAEVRDRGFLVELGVPYGEELAESANNGAGLRNRYRKITQGTLKGYSMADNVNRSRTYWQLKFQFEDTIAKYNKGKITWQQVEKDLDFKAYGSANVNIIRQRLIDGNLEGAFENMVREVLDETHFPYRRGASSRITFGLGGKIGTQFAQWPIEFVHTHARWVKTGQLDKIIRFWASSSAIKRSLKESIGVDTTNFTFYNPVNPSFSPTIKAGIDTVEMLNSLTQKNSEQLEENKDELVRALKSLGVPGGSQAQNIGKFYTSFDKGPVGPNGEYGVYDSRGRLKYFATFPELWLDLWGFTSNKEQAERELSGELRNARFDFVRAKQDVLELYQQEKYDEANEIIGKYGISIGPKDFDKYFIPFNQRTFDSLPAVLKPRFAPKVFPEQ